MQSWTLALIPATGVSKLLHRSVATFHRQSKAGVIPSPVYESERVNLWDRATVEAWIAAGRPVDVSTWLASRNATAPPAAYQLPR